jgi:Restriction endonuclease
MPKQKARITRTYGPIHFEDLDPHRFEDLIRELVYDFRDWQSIEATGRSGSDEGFDIRAYERIERKSRTETEEGDEIEDIHPMDGNLWMIQGKREKQIGPTKIKEILSDIDATNPPYAYILAASVNFSKASYDLFRSVLRNKGVMEFYLWGKGELEDMLHLPKNDRILFTFFGVSLVTQRRTRGTEIRSIVSIKNKVMGALGEGHSLYQQVLVRDLKDSHYPFKEEYKDFHKFPRWRELRAESYHPLGVWFNARVFFAYVDTDRKEWDYSEEADLLVPTKELDEEREKRIKAQDLVEAFWDFLPKANQAKCIVNSIIKFEDIVVVDPKGDIFYDFPHIYVDFDRNHGPFAGSRESLKIDNHEIDLDSSWKRINVFPKKFSKIKLGRVHTDHPVLLDADTLKSIKNYVDTEIALYAADERYDYLRVRDIVPISGTTLDNNEECFMQITYRFRMTIADYVAKQRNRRLIQRSIARQLGIEEIDALTALTISVVEFKRIYKWEFDKNKIAH